MAFSIAVTVEWIKEFIKRNLGKNKKKNYKNEKIKKHDILLEIRKNKIIVVIIFVNIKNW